MNFTYQPIQSWPGKMTTVRERSRFKASYGKTLDLLERELQHLGAKEIILQVALQPSDIRLDGRPRSGSRPLHPGIIISFESKFGPLCYPCDRFDNWEDNIRAIALSLEHLRAVDRYGVTRRGEQYKGWAQIEGPKSMTADEAKKLLDSFGGERPALMATHPDRGGNSDDFHKVQEARKILGML